MTRLASIPDDLAEAYAEIGTSGIARREGASRHQVNRWLIGAGIDLTGEKRGNIAQRRARPDDFAETYIGLGQDGCVDHYQTTRRTVRRWRNEAGAEWLASARSDHLAQKAASERRNEGESGNPPEIAADALSGPRCQPQAYSKPDPETELTRAAAHWLRFPRNGGWTVSRRTDGLYTVGNMPMTARQMIEFAGKRGFTQAMQAQYLDAAMGVMG